MNENTKNLFTEATLHLSPDRFNPALQWNMVSGFEISDPDLPSRAFALAHFKNTHHIGVVLPAHTFYDNYHVYDHVFTEGSILDIGWVDMHSVTSFLPGIIKSKTERILRTKGEVVQQTSTHVLFKIIDWTDHHNHNNDEYIKKHPYISMPKSYIKYVNGVEGTLTKVTPVISPEYTDDSIGSIAVISSCRREHTFGDVSISGFISYPPSDEPRKVLWSLIYNLRAQSYYLCHLGHPTEGNRKQSNLYRDSSLKVRIFKTDSEF